MTTLEASRTELENIKSSKVSEDFAFHKEEDNVYSTIYGRDDVQVIWYNLTPDKFVVTGSSETWSYKAQKGHHRLLYSYLSISLPCVKVLEEHKERCRIAWTRNIGNQVVQSAYCKVGAVSLGELDSYSMDAYHQYMVKQGDKAEEELGNAPSLQTYSTKLPATLINPHQPWFYTQSPQCAFPLFAVNDDLIHNYVFDLDTKNHIRMQVLNEDGDWENITFDSSKVEKVDNIEAPSLYGMFSSSDEGDIILEKECNDEMVYYIDNMSSYTNLNSHTVGVNLSVKVDTKQGSLLKCIFWMTPNESSKEYGIKSNYGTSWDNVVNSESPGRRVTMKYPTGNKFSNLDNRMFSSALVSRHYPSCPSSKGYHAFPCRNNCSLYGIDTGICNAITVEVKLEDIETAKWSTVKRSNARRNKDLGDEYKLVVISLVSRKMVIRDGDVIFPNDAQ